MPFRPMSGLVTLVLLLLTACATQSERARNLDSTLRAYEQAVRWGDYRAAFGFMEEEPADVSQQARSWENIRVSGYRTAPLRLDEQGRRAVQIVEIRYYDTRTMREHRLMDRQQWRYDADADRWYRVNPPPTFDEH